MFDFADRMNALQLTDEEVALFSAIVIIASGMGLALQRYSELLWSWIITLGIVHNVDSDSKPLMIIYFKLIEIAKLGGGPVLSSLYY